jgi:hypothetical protein
MVVEKLDDQSGRLQEGGKSAQGFTHCRDAIRGVPGAAEGVSRLMNAYLAKEKSDVFPELQEVFETVDVSVDMILKSQRLNRSVHSESM